MRVEKHSEDIAAMFGSIAFRYDFLNSVLSLGQERYWRRHVLKAVGAQQGEKVLDLAAGTGASSEPFADDGVDVTACDFSAEMLKIGERRRPDIDFIAGDAMDLPFPEETFDAVTISFGLRNVTQPKRALREMMRVTKPGGKIVIAEFSTPRCKAFIPIYKKYLVNVLPQIAEKLIKNGDAYAYLAESIVEWPDQNVLATWIKEAGWQRVKYRNLTGGIVALHRAYKPKNQHNRTNVHHDIKSGGY